MSSVVRTWSAPLALAWLSGALLAGGLLAACGESHSADEDAGITFDAALPGDGDVRPGSDGGTSEAEGDIGKACSGSADCDDICIDQFPGGYCSAPCGGGGMDCPGGSTCTPLGRGQSLCLADCDPMAERPCRTGYGCANSFMLPGPVCIPGCVDDTDCPDGLQCDPSGGAAGEGACFDPDSSFGDACAESEMCPSGGFCLEEGFAGWPGGACIGFGCDPAAGTGCAEGAVCIPSARGGGLCVLGCENDDSCRDGYTCDASDAYPDRTFCAPGCTSNDQCSEGRVCNPAEGTCGAPFDEGELGQACSTVMGACEGGACLTEFESGQPGSYCSYACDPEDPESCPGDGVCVEAGDGGLCLDGCDAEDDCRDAYACAPSDPADPESPTACVGACESDDACANDGFVCNEGTGLCTAAFDPDAVGAACGAGDDTAEGPCAGGVCLTDDDGWPEGTCALPGCRLSGEGPSEACPEGSTCVDDGAGDPELGACVPTCEPDADAPCREGYACTASDGSNACVPE